MRLIDADAYLKKVCTYKETGCGSCRLQTVCPVDEPTIDAIPVKYIIEHLNKGGEDKISECLKEWKENG